MESLLTNHFADISAVKAEYSQLRHVNEHQVVGRHHPEDPDHLTHHPYDLHRPDASYQAPDDIEQPVEPHRSNPEQLPPEPRQQHCREDDCKCYRCLHDLQEHIGTKDCQILPIIGIWSTKGVHCSDHLCEVLSMMSVQEKAGLLDFVGKHTRFIYNGDDEIEGVKEVREMDVVSPLRMELGAGGCVRRRPRSRLYFRKQGDRVTSQLISLQSQFKITRVQS